MNRRGAKGKGLRSLSPSHLEGTSEEFQRRQNHNLFPSFYFFLLVVPYFIQAAIVGFILCHPVFDVFAILFFSVFSLAFICPGNTNWAPRFLLILLHIHTWDLPTIITVLSCAAMWSSSRAVGASLTCLDFEGKEKESVTATPLLSQKAQGFELATFQSQNCVYRLLQSYLLWSTCHVNKQLLGGECHFYDKNHSGQTDLRLRSSKRCQMMLFPQPNTADTT